MEQQDTNEQSAQRPKHENKSAFCHMVYSSSKQDHRANIQLVIWNSRDGYAPDIIEILGKKLMCISPEYCYEPFYKPKQGDYVWREASDYNEKDVKTERLEYKDEGVKGINPVLELVKI